MKESRESQDHSEHLRTLFVSSLEIWLKLPKGCVNNNLISLFLVLFKMVPNMNFEINFEVNMGNWIWSFSIVEVGNDTPQKVLPFCCFWRKPFWPRVTRQWRVWDLPRCAKQKEWKPIQETSMTYFRLVRQLLLLPVAKKNVNKLLKHWMWM